MSKADVIQNKLYKAYRKIAKVLGREFSVYRSSELSNPLDESKWIWQGLVAFSQDWGYGAPAPDDPQIWKTWIDGRYDNNFSIKVGDYLYSAERNEKFVVISADPHLDIKSLKISNTISVTRASWPSGSSPLPTFEVGETTIAENVPVNITPGGGGSGDNNFIPTTTDAFIGVPGWTIKGFFPVDSIKEQDVITDERGHKMLVISVAYTSEGCMIRAREPNPHTGS